MFPVYKLSRETAQPENICNIVFEKAKGRGGTVNRIEGSLKKGVNICAGSSFLIKLNSVDLQFIKKETLAQVFSCEFCKIYKNNLFAEHHRTTASNYRSIISSEGRIGKQNCKL